MGDLPILQVGSALDDFKPAEVFLGEGRLATAFWTASSMPMVEDPTSSIFL